MAVNFVTKIAWPTNDLLFPADWYGVAVPSGLTGFNVRAPNFVDVTGMSRLSRDGTSVRVGAGGQLGMVDGMVTNGLSVDFDNIQTQWKCTPLGGPTAKNGPGQFVFQGGNVTVTNSLGIHILNINDPKLDDPLSVQIFAEIYGHELLHVLDEIDIVKNWLPPKLNPEPTIAKYLVRAEPYVYGTQSQTLPQVEKEFREHIKKSLHTEIHNVWAVEANRRQALRDAPAQYKIVQDKVDTLRTKQINRP